jgi:hypothetical protein
VSGEIRCVKMRYGRSKMSTVWCYLWQSCMCVTGNSPPGYCLRCFSLMYQNIKAKQSVVKNLVALCPGSHMPFWLIISTRWKMCE